MVGSCGSETGGTSPGGLCRGVYLLDSFGHSLLLRGGGRRGQGFMDGSGWLLGSLDSGSRGGTWMGARGLFVVVG